MLPHFRYTTCLSIHNFINVVTRFSFANCSVCGKYDEGTEASGYCSCHSPPLCCTLRLKHNTGTLTWKTYCWNHHRPMTTRLHFEPPWYCKIDYVVASLSITLKRIMTVLFNRQCLSALCKPNSEKLMIFSSCTVEPVGHQVVNTATGDNAGWCVLYLLTSPTLPPWLLRAEKLVGVTGIFFSLRLK